MTNKLTDERAEELRAAMPPGIVIEESSTYGSEGAWFVYTCGKELTQEQADALAQAPVVIDHWRGRVDELRRALKRIAGLTLGRDSDGPSIAYAALHGRRWTP